DAAPALDVVAVAVDLAVAAEGVRHRIAIARDGDRAGVGVVVLDRVRVGAVEIGYADDERDLLAPELGLGLGLVAGEAGVVRDRTSGCEEDQDEHRKVKQRLLHGHTPLSVKALWPWVKGRSKKEGRW